MTSSKKSTVAESRGLAVVLEAGWYGFGFAAVLAMGLVNLFYPFGLDQAAYFYGANAMDQGATLYVDYWDNKQPGLYAFYLLAGRLFGFSEFGVHLLELIWMMAFAMVLMITLRLYLRAPWLSALAPAATIGVYYATVGEHELTQLEMMVGFPLYLTAWCGLRGLDLASDGSAPKRAMLLFCLAGVFAAVATTFKLLLAPIPITFWLVTSAYLLAQYRIRLATLVMRLWVPAASGVMLILGAVVLWFWQASALEELLWTSFVYPPQALETSPPASLTRLLTAGAFFASNTAPWLLFAGIAAVMTFLRPGRHLSGPLLVTMLAWLLLSGFLFLLQRFSWWPHHALLLLTPFGVLAVCGIDGATGYLRRLLGPARSAENGGRSHGVVSAMAVAALMAIPPVASLANPWFTKAQPLLAGAAVLGQGVQIYHWKVSKNYKRLWKGSRFLTWPVARPGPIYVFGNAMVYHFTKRRSAHETTGSAWRFYLPSQIKEILAALDDKQAPYVFVDQNDTKLYNLRPQVAAYLAENYKMIARDDSGVWYERLEGSKTQ